MTIEEKIKEIANKYAKTETIPSAGLILTARNAFVDGANFGRELGMKEAFEWIPMNEKSPEVSDKPYKILAKDDFSVNDNEVVEKIRNKEDVQYVELNYTHWRPINQEDMP